MELAIFRLIEGSFGALMMIGFGMLSIVSVPVCLVVALVAASKEKKRPAKFYVLLAAVPVVSFALAVGIFLLRSVVATFFVPMPT